MFPTLILLGVAVLLVRVGLALYFAGLARSKNSAGAVLRSLADLWAGTLAFWALGAAILAQQSNQIFGIKLGMLLGWQGTPPELFFYAAIVLVATAALNGSMAERTRFFSVIAGSIVLAGVVIPVAAFWAWNGWLRKMGMLDLAGAAPLHLAAGIFAAGGAVIAGPRAGKYNRDGSANIIPGHNVPLAGIGVLLTLVGFIPYVVGCTYMWGRGEQAVAQAAMNVLLAGSAGGAAALGVARVRYGKADAGLALLGCLGGLVSITAAGGLMGGPAALLTGAIAGVIVPAAAIAIDLLARIDDPAAGVSIHAVGGAWGLIAAAIFVPGTWGEHFQRLGVHLLAIVVIGAWAALTSAGLFFTLRATVGIRSREADEYDGLDLSEHDLGAYPDFQQTMIKSYHLREA